MPDIKGPQLGRCVEVNREGMGKEEVESANLKGINDTPPIQSLSITSARIGHLYVHTYHSLRAGGKARSELLHTYDVLISSLHNLNFSL